MNKKNTNKSPIAVVRTCASSGNLGPGFDILGLALDIYDKYHVYESEDRRYHIDYHGDIKDYSLPKDESSLVVKSIKAVLQKYLHRINPLKDLSKIEIPLEINTGIRIPIGKGLGSSAAALAAGLLIANKIYNLNLEKEELLNIGVDIEGHPDNLAASLYGGLVVCYISNGRYKVKKINMDKNFKILLIVTENNVDTRKARKLLPRELPFEDCIYNIRNTVLLVESLREGNLENVSDFMDDRIHQPKRRKIYPTSFKLVRELTSKYKIPAAISGAGPTVIIILGKMSANKDKEIKAEIEKYPGFKCILTSISQRGSYYE